MLQGPPPTLAAPRQKAAAQAPLLSCKLNCYGSAAETIALREDSDIDDAKPQNVDRCRQRCRETTGCEAVVSGNGKCYGKASVFVSKCQRGDGEFTTEFIASMPFGSCTIMGDPHLITFDNSGGATADTMQLEAGIYKLVSSPKLEIQGRFGYSVGFPAAASLTDIAVSGAMLGGDRLTVSHAGAAGFVTLWNNMPILDGGMGDSFEAPHIVAETGEMDSEFISHAAGHAIEGLSALGSVPSMLFKIGPGLRIYLLLGNDTMNAVITMQKLVGGQDGYCGNFDCDSSNDFMADLKQRGQSGALEPSGSLFSWLPPLPKEQASPPEGVQSPDIQDCVGELLKQADRICGGMPEPGMRESCIFDVCASGNTAAGTADIVAQVLAANVQQKSSYLPGLSIFTGIPLFVQGCFVLALVGILVGRGALRATSGEQRGGYSRVAFQEESTLRPGGMHGMAAAEALLP